METIARVLAIVIALSLGLLTFVVTRAIRNPILTFAAGIATAAIVLARG